MKRVYCIIIGGLLCLSSFSQRVASLDVVGEASKMVLPDKGIMNLEIKTIKNSESEAYTKLNDMSGLVLKRLKADGFSDDQIKLADFSMSTLPVGKNKKVQYEAAQSMIVKFPLDKQRIFNIYSKLMKDSVQGVEIYMQTECSEELTRKIQEELITLALKDAKRKAGIIAAESDCDIFSVSNIGYKYFSDNRTFDVPPPTRNSIKFVPPVLKADALASEEDSSMPTNYFSINEQEFSEQVKVTYLIGAKK
ncbi:SIMPL domain-containing protein [Parabacteroides sp. FAFU027]|uniref:SIMPL domain-containing protein n=1 Tax=Parabacteroides sp. FAFU027 TaxID=2922715 RepID=UPI001FB03D0C|nr:SIMPL domain-containing protein [Parabacteroides sp. FAFU027]